ncbi:DMT family transporter [Benzoatithermus flavus]|uniref:DMT family transporter n=1 Tax=Benzoatithermus flavus TaxID=3108223 RepID=A0ABU8XSH5_9PROT
MNRTESAASTPPACIDLTYLRSAILVVLAGTFWSTGGVLVKLAEAADARQIVLWRSLFVFLFLVVVLGIRQRGALLRTFRTAGWNGVLGGWCLVGAFLGSIEAFTRTTVANVMFILAAQPFLAALFARLLLGERVGRQTWLAMAAAIVGVTIMVAPGLALGGASGSLLALASAVSFALFSVTLRRGRYGDGSPSIVWGALFSALVAFLLVVAGKGADAVLVGRHDLLICAAMGIGQIGCGMLAFAAGSRHLPAADLTLLALTEVILGPVWAWLVVGEVPPTATLAGGALVLGATALQALSGARRLGA